MNKTWKIGTRGSLLALTQCQQTRELLESRSGEKFELVVIKTQGDQQTDKPLWQLEGKDFFTKELDEALLKNEVDLVVHSYKDLGSERPHGIELAAVVERKYGHDILLIPKKNIEALKAGTIKELIVGTSSPRRITNLENQLSSFVPSNPKVSTKMLRGNVNTRVQKLQDGDYHAIVLAMPGLERLAQGKESKIELKRLMQGLDFMILPASKFPWAASQGALAIEMNKDNPKANDLAKILGTVHHKETQEAVKRERKAFNQYGGGCHLAVGVAVIASKACFIHSHRGVKDEQSIEELYLEPAPKKVKAVKVFEGMPHHDKLLKKSPTMNIEVDLNDKDVFATSSNVFEALSKTNQSRGLWAAGTKTWQKLASANHWVNGAADSLGEDQLKEFEKSELLKIIRGSDFNWLVLSAEDASSQLGPVVETYTRETQTTSSEFKRTIEETSDFFWTSFPQYQTYLEHFPGIHAKRHWCGLGKTYDAFVSAKIDVIPVSGILEFRKMTQA
ncbi:MAG: hydroxymethylbilane synthase [Bdellovibrionales bacterium CG12_big_fil_rev_8_21_14_0_65_38_15]|nr:MAG: hydroxymethylbilane synthase [Bdellovibrionales bacterium CG22_combo_CG10-13_8_21_14_all_38_13]PIQ55649.1 MAG: hydroxymethylbilane synthase [Bdellovibrionales bacterium CG12_big_fil_rev_8_21_14_0_65_38_15]PIR30659.1 MAG: hydroxymethylbilane synthase [Bdellovibrionales bacterium CG11_big_fil_rev_8_21_14_0_20_38_13]